MKKIGLVLMVFMPVFWACQDDEVSLGYEIPEVKKAADFVDSDGKVYRCIEVGGLVWMADNLAKRLPLGGREGCFTYNETLLDSVDYSKVKVNMFDPRYKEIFLEELAAAYQRKEISDSDWSVIEGINKALPLPSYFNNIYSKAPGSYEVAMVCKTLADDRMYKEACQVVYRAATEESRKHFEEAEAANGHYSEKYGFLYTYEAALAAVPEGWRLPSDEDWKMLERALGMADGELEKQDVWRGERQAVLLKEGEEGIGFDVCYGGARGLVNGERDNYINLGQNAYFWCSDMVQTDTISYGMTRNIAIYTDRIMRMSAKVDHRSTRPVLYSVRCVRNKELK